MIGRSFPYIYVLSDRFVAPLSILRIGFYPLIILCVHPVLLSPPEIWMYVINFFFALTNGYIGSKFLNCCFFLLII